MYNRVRAQILRFMRVPHDPEPPFGAPGSVRVFRAGRNFFHLRLVRWGVTQLVALAGIVFWVTIFVEVEAEVHKRREAASARVDPRSTRNFDDYLEKIGAAEKSIAAAPVAQAAPEPAKPQKKPRVRVKGLAGFKLMLVQAALWLPPWGIPLLWGLKIAGILAYLAQLPFTYMIARLEYELHWYIVTDRSLRIRTGVWKVSEATMSFANLQQVAVSQGPLQRLLGIADVQVQSAGGGTGDMEKHQDHSLHTGIFHGVDNAHEIRDLIVERLRLFRQAGLGDPDETHALPATVAATDSAPSAGTSGDALNAARELLVEARALRASLG